MSPELPAPIAAYYEADKKDGDAVARCFAEDATVIDEARTHHGRPAIARWLEEAATAFTYTVEPLSVAEKDGATVVTCHVEGDFPGSPVRLDNAFTLDGELISRLEIT